MAEVLVSVVNELKKYSQSLDVDVISGADAVRLMSVAAEIESIACFLKSSFARRVEKTNQHQKEGFGSAEDFIASKTGSTGSEARGTLATARQLEQLPDTRGAFAGGRLSAGQAAEVARGASADPSAESALLEVASSDSAEALRRASRRLEKLPSLQRRRRSRRFSHRAGSFGMTDFWGSLPNEDFALLGSALGKGAQKFFRQARKEGRHESQATYLADALVELAQGACGEVGSDTRTSGDGRSPSGRSKPKININVLVDHQVLVGSGPGVCEIPGFGPVSPETVRQWADDCYLNVLLRKGKDITTVGSERRYIPVDIQRALSVQQPICGIRGCEQSVGLELDHNQELRHGGLTRHDNLGWLCRHHHMLKTHKGFTLKGKPGDYILVPPGRPPDGGSGGPPDDGSGGSGGAGPLGTAGSDEAGPPSGSGDALPGGVGSTAEVGPPGDKPPDGACARAGPLGDVAPGNKGLGSWREKGPPSGAVGSAPNGGPPVGSAFDNSLSGHGPPGPDSTEQAKLFPPGMT